MKEKKDIKISKSEFELLERMRELDERYAVDEEGSEEIISQSGMACLRDWGTGLVSFGTMTESGPVHLVRTSDGSVSAIVTYEFHEQYYANIVVLVARHQPVMRTIEGFGPYLTQGLAADAAGKWSGDVVNEMYGKEEGPEDDDDNSRI